MIPQSARYVAVDFETANAQRVSACAIGVAVLENGEITDRFTSLIKPPDDYFAPINVKIHGITSEMVADAPTFDELFPRLHEMADGCPLLGYSIFDRSVIKSLSDFYGLRIKRSRLEEYIDVCGIARGKLPDLKNHKLPTIVKHFNLGDFKHHDAAADAEMCARAFHALMQMPMPAARQAPRLSSAAEAFVGFTSSITDDGVVDYKEALELKYFLSVLPATSMVAQLLAVVDHALEDGVVDEAESATLVQYLTRANELVLSQREEFD